MGLEKGYVFNIKDKQYVIISVIKYNGIDYGFINDVVDGEPETEKYHIIYIDNGKLIFLNEEKIANELIPMFQKEITDDLKKNNLI